MAANPYKRINIFTPEFVVKYAKKPVGTMLPPHVYDLASNAYTSMIRDGNSQSVVISGESGAGKTEETKLTLQFLAEVAKNDKFSESGKKGPEQLLLQSSPILEAMGNAKTVRNNNSSRFGKYMEIIFDKGFKIMGGKSTKYLLEKSRVIKPNTGERNYHVFYLLNYLPPAEKKDLKYDNADQFTYCTTVEGINDEADFKEFSESWTALGVPDDEVLSVLKIISGILHVGNVEFEADDEGNASVVNDEELEDVGVLFSNDPELLETTLTFRNMQSGGRSIVVIPLKEAQATMTQEELCKGTYSRLFDWCVVRDRDSDLGHSDSTMHPLSRSAPADRDSDLGHSCPFQAFFRDEAARQAWEKVSSGVKCAQQLVRGHLGRVTRRKLAVLLKARTTLEAAVASAKERWPPAPDKAVSSKALSFCCASTTFLSKPVPFRAVCPARHRCSRPH
eukprot:SAG22_NODE_272_length_13192_cov_311.812495_4_plen_449_part_00